MTTPLSDSWLAGQADSALSSAVAGDEIFQVVDRYAGQLEREWISAAAGWQGLVRKASRHLFGLLPQVPEQWMREALLSASTRRWPKGLTSEERKILGILREAAHYHPSGIPRGTKADPPSEHAALSSFRKLAKLAKKEMALPMWRSYNEASQQAAREIGPLCLVAYEEVCDIQEAELVFQGDMERGWRVKSLDVSPETYRVFPAFLEWIAA